MYSSNSVFLLWKGMNGIPGVNGTDGDKGETGESGRSAFVSIIMESVNSENLIAK